MFKKLGFALRRTTADFRALPDFIIIGAARAGTTSLFRYLSLHPAIIPSLRKEVHFFDIHYAEGMRWYRAHFPLRSTLRRRAAALAQRVITGEASPYYLFHPLVPARAAEHVPQAKLIVLLRNPVERVISDYHFVAQDGAEPLGMADALATEGERLVAFERAVAADPYHYSLDHQRRSYTTRGIYVDQIKAWHARFPKQQMLILKTEDLLAEPKRIVLETCRFLGVQPWAPETFPSHNACEYPDPDPALRRRLQEYFAPHNRRLYEYLGRDFGWDA